MATETALVEETGALHNSKSQDNYKVERTLLEVKHLIRAINTENIDEVYSELKKHLITTSIKMLEEIVNWIYEEAIRDPSDKYYGGYSGNRMQLIAKLCKLCAKIEVSDSGASIVQVITFQEILIKVILSEYERMSKQPSCEKKLLNWFKHFKGSEDKKLEWIQKNCIKMEKNENKRALRSINFVIELFILKIVSLETLYKIVQFTIMKSSLKSLIECLHALLPFIKIDFKQLKWADGTKHELLSGVFEKMYQLLQDNSTSQYTKNIIKDLVVIWPKEHVSKHKSEIQPLDPHGDVTLNRTENPRRPRRIMYFLTHEENQLEEFLNIHCIHNKFTAKENNMLIQAFLDLPGNPEENINLFYEKAIEEQIHSSYFAKLSKALSKLEFLNRQGEKVTFRKLVITNCQTEYEKSPYSLNRRMVEDYEPKSGMHFGENEKKRFVGNLRFISELFNVGLLTLTIMYKCMDDLLDNPDDLSLECLCILLTTSGKQLETRSGSNREELDKYFQILTRVTGIVDSFQISSEARTMLQDVIELSQNKWIPKK